MPRWVWLCGATAVVAIVVASLIPAKLQLRTGLPWPVKHFLRHLFCLASPRPFVVAGSLMVSAALLEARHGSEERPRIGQKPGLNPGCWRSPKKSDVSLSHGHVRA
jgi:hypothetical protein